MAEVIATLASERGRGEDGPPPGLALNIVVPGATITSETGFMRGHGTFLEDEVLYASVAGVVEHVNKVVSVRPARTRYVGEVGDVVVGRIVEVSQRRWKVDIQSRLHGVLKLSSVNLPGGVLRRKSASDELMMREFFKEGDLISAEVQQIYQEDGTLSLHTRSLRYGRLGGGAFVAVSPALIRRSKHHMHVLPCGVAVVLGTNGFIWIGPRLEEDTTRRDASADAMGPDRDMRLRIARVRNCIEALATRHCPIFETSIVYTYEDSQEHHVKDLLQPDVVYEVTARAYSQCFPHA